MSAPIWKRREIESPCVNICIIHPEARICTGCYRTGDEIARWSKLTPEARRALMAILPERAPLLQEHGCGHANRPEGSTKDF